MNNRMTFERPTADLPTDRADRQAIADQLRNNPGSWALIGQRPGTPGAVRMTTYVISKGGPGWQMFGPGFEARTATMFGENRIYARYVGDAS